MWLAFVVALGGALVLTPAARTMARRLSAFDRPDGQRKLHDGPIPLWGGVAVYLAVVAALLVVRWFSPEVGRAFVDLSTVLIGAAGFVCLFGGIDDTRDLNPRFKLLLQVCSVLPIVVGGHHVDRVVAFGYPLELGWLGIPLTVFWLVGCINALNLLDGMDGLASLVGLSTAVMMAIIASSEGHPHVAIVAIALAGALVGFLVFNLPPASIYLGDSGSMVIGLIVGILGIQGSLKTTATLSITAPVVVMSIPLLDVVLAIVRRKLTGRRFDAADRGHIHHRLLERGLSNWQALWIIGALCLATGAAATAATIWRNEALAWITVVSVVVLLVSSRAFGHHEVALVKLSIRTALLRLLDRLVMSSRWTRNLAWSHPASLPFDAAWRKLVGEAALWQAKQVELSIWRDGCEHAHHLAALPDESAKAECNSPYHWSLTLSLGQRNDRCCELRVVGASRHGGPPWYLSRIARTMKTYAEHWAAHPEHVPVSTLRIVAAGPAADRRAA